MVDIAHCRYRSPMPDFTLPNMHDWTLLDASFDWKSAKIAIRFQTADGPQVLIASDAAQLQMLRDRPWGPSVSVNAVELIAGTPHSVLRIEVQSGDVITVEAGGFRLEK